MARVNVELAVNTVPAPTVELANVYLLVVVVVLPMSKIPTVALPAADPKREATVRLVPVTVVAPE